MVEATAVLFGVLSAALVGSALLVLYPVYAHAENVMYTRGVVVLAASLLTLTAGWVAGNVLYYGVVEVATLGALPQALFTLSSALFLWANWEFARDLLQLDDRDVPADFGDGEAVGGFEEAFEGQSGAAGEGDA